MLHAMRTADTRAAGVCVSVWGCMVNVACHDDNRQQGCRRVGGGVGACVRARMYVCEFVTGVCGRVYEYVCVCVCALGV